MSITSAAIRFPIDPRGIPASKAARRLGLTQHRFDEVRESLYQRGFPRPDPDTGQYDLKAIDAWMDRSSGLTPETAASHASDALQRRLEKWDGRSLRKT